MLTNASITNYQWHFGDSASGANNTSTAIAPTHTFSAPGQYTVTLTAAAGSSNYTQTLVVEILPAPAVSVSPTGPINLCSADSIILQAAALPTLSYQWLQNGQPLANDTSPALMVSTSGFYQVMVSDSVCPALSDSVEVTVHPQASAQISPASPSPVCFGQTIPLSAAQSTGNTYAWLLNGQAIPGANGPVFEAPSSGNYQVIVSSNGFCADTSEVVQVTVHSLPEVTIQQSDELNCTDPVTLTATGADSYLWSTGVTSQAVIIYPGMGGFYAVTGQNQFGCSDTDSVNIPIPGCIPLISVPNIITPNNDGVNDVFELSVEGQDFGLQIFNRWGKEVFNRANYNRQPNWNAAGLPDGVYFYHITAADGKTWKGWVEVVR